MKPAPHDPDEDLEAAARWVARRDRGLTPAEQDAYLQWIAAGRARGRAVADLERTWARLDAVRQWRPLHSRVPNADLLAAPARRRRGPWALALAAAAALALAAVWERAPRGGDEERIAQIVPGPERLVLEDGSLVELNSGAEVRVRYATDVRHVRLVRGEAHFTVAKDAARPFVVEVEGFSVRAVGTAFLVHDHGPRVSVLVTEGVVQMDEAGDARVAVAAPLARLSAGQLAQAVRPGEGGAGPEIAIREVTPHELEAAMHWRGIRLEFDDAPLRDVVREFNRYNLRQLAIGDPATGAIRIGGSFRADNLQAFLHVLESAFGVAAEPADGGIVLRGR